jgi:hypothetical protein
MIFFEMILIYYAHSKNIDNLKVVEFETFKIKKLLYIKLKFQGSFTTCQRGVMYMTSKKKL